MLRSTLFLIIRFSSRSPPLAPLVSRAQETPRAPSLDGRARGATGTASTTRVLRGAMWPRQTASESHVQPDLPDAACNDAWFYWTVYFFPKFAASTSVAFATAPASVAFCQAVNSIAASVMTKGSRRSAAPDPASPRRRVAQEAREVYVVHVF